MNSLFDLENNGELFGGVGGEEPASTVHWEERGLWRQTHLSPVPAVLRLLCDKNLSKFLKPSSRDSHLTVSESAVQ